MTATASTIARASLRPLSFLYGLRHRGRLRVAFLVVLALCLLSIRFVDRPVAEAVFALHGTWVREAFNQITKLGEGGMWYGLAAAALLVSVAGRLVVARATVQATLWRLRNAALFLAGSMALSGIAVPLTKMLVGRLRPKMLYYHGLYDFAPLTFRLGDVCFPSGHTQTIVAALAALCFIFPGRRMVAFCLFTAVLVGGSRIVLGAHFVADVMMGAYVGLAGTVLLHRFFQRRGLPVRLS